MRGVVPKAGVHPRGRDAPMRRDRDARQDVLDVRAHAPRPLAGDAKGAVAELAQVVVENEEPSLVEVASIWSPFRTRRSAVVLYDRGDRSEAAGRLWRLANEYSDRASTKRRSARSAPRSHTTRI
jgi:hypothetical protein